MRFLTFLSRLCSEPETLTCECKYTQRNGLELLFSLIDFRSLQVASELARIPHRPRRRASRYLLLGIHRCFSAESRRLAQFIISSLQGDKQLVCTRDKQYMGRKSSKRSVLISGEQSVYRWICLDRCACNCSKSCEKKNILL